MRFPRKEKYLIWLIAMLIPRCQNKVSRAIRKKVSTASNSGAPEVERNSRKIWFIAFAALFGAAIPGFANAISILPAPLPIWSLGSVNTTGAPSTTPTMNVPGRFAVDSTGAATYGIPIVVPPGTNSMVPRLSLNYASGASDGVVGLGWSLDGLPSITRCPETVAQDAVHGGTNYDLNDRFCLDGQRLILLSGTGGYGADNSQYRTEIESYSKIIAHGTMGAGPAWFEVHTKGGQYLQFGNPTNANGGASHAQILAVGTSTVAVWAVNQIQDISTNYIAVTYTNDAVNGQYYPARIDYTGNINAGTTPYNSVQFSYTTRASSDIVPTYQAGSLSQTTVLLSDIKTYTASTLVSDYQLSYNPGSAGLSHDQLKQVKLCGNGGSCLAASTFSWQGGVGLPAMTPHPTMGIATGEPVVGGDWNGDGLTDLFCYSASAIQLGTLSGTSFTTSTISLDNNGFAGWTGNPCHRQLIATDLDGDGYTDFLSQVLEATWSYINNKSGVLTEVDDVSTYFGSNVVQLGPDFNGDGLPDVSYQGGSISTFFSTGATVSTHGTFTTGFTRTPTLGPGDSAGAAYIGDYDGDGCADILFQTALGTSALTYYSCQPKYATTTPPLNLGAENSGIVQFVTGDFNGDGKTDVLYVPTTGTAGLYLSTGTNFIAQSFSIPSTWKQYGIVTGDFNGDGKTDIALIADGGVGHLGVGTSHEVWLSTGTAFVKELSIANTNPADTSVVASVYDWNSDGASDIWFVKPSGDTEDLFAFKPELMTVINNGLGASTSITYDKINNPAIYTKGAGAIYPTQDAIGAQYVVSQVSTSDGVGGAYIQNYSYGEAKTDLSGRGSLGFSNMTVNDPQTGIVDSTDYATAFPETGLVLDETRTRSGVILSSSTNIYTYANLGGSGPGAAYYSVSLHQNTVARKDLTGTAYPTATTTYQYDIYGNVTDTLVQPGDGSTSDTVNTFNNDPANWIFQLATSTTQNIVGTSHITRATSYSYDPTSKLLISEIAEPGAADPTLTLERDFSYDAYGNATATTGKGCVWLSGSCTVNAISNPTSVRTSTNVFDTATYHGQFLTKTSNPLGQSDSLTYAVGFGVPLTHTDPNNLVTSWTYDAFGRKTLEHRADSNGTSIAYTYCTGLPSGESCPTNASFDVISTPISSSSAQNGPISITYYDGLSRVIASDVEAFDGPSSGCSSSPCWSRRGTVYDGSGNVATTTRPYFLTDTPEITTYTPDALGRVTAALFPDGSHTLYGYNALTTTVTDNLGHATTQVQNAEGLTASVKDAASNTVTYVYDAFGNPLSVTNAGVVTTAAYDVLGRKITISDPDMGGSSHPWTYVYDGFGELYSQKDALSQLTTFSYDALGRGLSRTEPSLTSTWTYDTASGKGVGQVASATTGSSYTRTYAYDTLARPSSIALMVDAVAHAYSLSYNANGELSSIGYPSGLTVSYGYTALGYLSSVNDAGGSHVAFWTANTRDAEFHLTQQTAGNGVVTSSSFDPATGLPQTTLAGASGSIFDAGYTFDTVGNLTLRSWKITGGSTVTEKACYDNLNRLTNYHLTTVTTCPDTAGTNVSYNALGNITEKTDVCPTANCMTYGPATAGPHAVTSIVGSYRGVTNPIFTYDANGNLKCISSGSGCTGTIPMSASYNSFNMAASVSEGANSATLTYDPEHARVKMVTAGAGAGTTTYLNDPVSGSMEEEFVSGSAITFRDYVMADGQMVALRSAVASAPPVWGAATWGSFNWTASATPVITYFASDHLGSISVITDASAAVTERDSYDPWGKRRNPDGTAASCGAISSATTRGFTQQEMMDQLCLINFNARLYDPSLGRFLSADGFIPDIYDGQSLNRYSYTENRPLTEVDPTGNDNWDPGFPNFNDTDIIPGLIDSGAGDGGGCGDMTDPGNTLCGVGSPPAPQLQPDAGPTAAPGNSASGCGVIDCVTVNAQRLPPMQIGAAPSLEPIPLTPPPLPTLDIPSTAQTSDTDVICRATSTVDFINKHQSDATALAASNSNTPAEILGLSLAEVGSTGNSLSRNGNNYFSMEGKNSANFPYSTGVKYTSGGAPYAVYPSYYASGQSFLSRYGAGVSGITDPTAFAQALQNMGYNSGNSANGGKTGFAQYTSGIIQMTARRMKRCR